jgi:hypothetical protein
VYLTHTFLASSSSFKAIIHQSRHPSKAGGHD